MVIKRLLIVFKVKMLVAFEQKSLMDQISMLSFVVF